MSISRWVISDHHFDHENIIRYCRRPFVTVGEMNQTMVQIHNNHVQPDDLVYLVGDFSMQKDPERIGRWVRRLNGRKVLILGNHDALKPFTYVEIGFESVHTSLCVTVEGYTREIVLVHDPSAAQDPEKLWITGHTHNNCFGPCAPHIVNVCVEMLDYQPIRLEQAVTMSERNRGLADVVA